MPKSASLNTQSKIVKRIPCVERFKHKRPCSYHAAEGTGKHGHGYAKRWVGRATVEKSKEDRPPTGRPSKITETYIPFIKSLVEADPKVGSAEIARKLAAEFGVSVTAKTVRNAVKKKWFQVRFIKESLAAFIVWHSRTHAPSGVSLWLVGVIMTHAATYVVSRCPRIEVKPKFSEGCITVCHT
jgi:hypothetical protein